MKPEKRHLIETLLDGDQAAQRQATLRAGGRILSRRRWQRTAMRSFAGIAILAAAAIFIQKTTTPQPRTLTAVVLPQGTTASVTDAQLLEMFPNTPEGLIKLPNGKKRFVFLRAEDEKRYMAKF